MFENHNSKVILKHVATGNVVMKAESLQPVNKDCDGSYAYSGWHYAKEIMQSSVGECNSTLASVAARHSQAAGSLH
jgi:hypothetical protein